MAANADSSAVFEDEAFHNERITDLDSGIGGGNYEELVERRPPRRVRGAWPARDREGAEVGRVRVDRWTVRCNDTVEQPPAVERIDPRGMDEVGRGRVARERRAVDCQNSITLACEQHRGRRAGATRSHHDRVVCLRHGSSSVECLSPRLGEESRRRFGRTTQLVGRRNGYFIRGAARTRTRSPLRARRRRASRRCC